ncbi:ErfK/YbiS/YcfS/YnhG [Magnetococcus marinus MC-1]|uniref:ErfK/YbiS/YcfS/YnhG n=1 Tax=Magnetococcus marinus (strain ATCC BAA-1437 / JCM 17883 / MC-1) TaxID=156889 RepID=A0LC03_MAGMM|nr:L,D-transpeptidase family protein [Magnetococcus marinus]ABK45496.1 ErfK/YbiS/YcfS/YnhG [Magnetococcus marinus MC-1]
MANTFTASRLLLLILLTSVVVWHATMANAAEDKQKLFKGILLPDDRIQMSSYERLFLKGMDAIANNDMALALMHFRTLTETKPDFKLAQLIYADLLLAQASPISQFGAKVNHDDEEFQRLMNEAKARLMHQLKPIALDKLPAPLLRLSKRHSHVIAVDLTRSRLFLFDNREGMPKLIADYYISSGKKGAEKIKQGDKRTPAGLYYVTEYIPGEKLPDLYGAGAMPINYPNEWDRLHKRTGYGIWLHGTVSGTYSRPPRASDGCVALTNLDFEELEEKTSIGTPVLLSKRLLWIKPEAWKKQQQLFLQRLHQWYQDLQSGDPSRALRHYAPDFNNQRQDYESWSKYIRNVVLNWKNSAFILTDPSIMQYPGEQAMVVVTFTQQDPDGPPGSWRLRRQYWKMQPADGVWHIVYEDVG